MGYPEHLVSQPRAISKNVFTSSIPLSLFNFIHVGARMTLIKTGEDNFAIYSTAPYKPEIVDPLNELLKSEGIIKADESFVDKVSSIIIPNIEHTVALPGWHKALTDKGIKLNVIGPDSCYEKVKGLVNVAIPASQGYKVLKGDDLVKLGLDAKDPLANSEVFQFMYFPGHKNSEVVMFDNRDKVIMEGDIYFNLQNNNSKNEFSSIFNEQFGNQDPNTGFKGWFSSRMMASGSMFQNFVRGKLFKDPESIKSGIDLMAKEWKFEKIIPCHGDVVDSNGAAVFLKNIKGA